MNIGNIMWAYIYIYYEDNFEIVLHSPTRAQTPILGSKAEHFMLMIYVSGLARR